MSPETWTALALAAVAAGAGVLVEVTTRRAADGRAVPNPISGIRTRATMASSAAWRRAHRAAAPWTRRARDAALALGGIGALLAFVAPTLSTVISIVSVTATTALATTAGVVGDRAARVPPDA